jgi:hypothetical protein
MAKRRVNPQEIRKDVRSGMDEYDLMEKHGLSQDQLPLLLRKMMLAGYLAESELFEWLSLTDRELFRTFGQDEGITGGAVESPGEGVRPLEPTYNAPLDRQSGTTGSVTSSLKRIRVHLPVWDISDSRSEGILRDLSEREFRLASPHADFCDKSGLRTFAISADLIGEPEPIIVQARCQWVEKRGKRKDYYVGGFEVTRISDQCLERVRQLIERLGLRHSSARDDPSAASGRVDRVEYLSNGFSEAFDSELTEKFVRGAQGFPQPPQRDSEKWSGQQPENNARSARFGQGTKDMERRRWPRNYLTFSVPVYEAGVPENRGLIEDITERGIGVTGIRAGVHETKALVIQSGQVAEVSFEAICCWSTRGTDGGYKSGFEITRIAEEALVRVRDFIRGLTISH